MTTPSQTPIEDQFPTESLEIDVKNANNDDWKKTVIVVRQKEIPNGWVSIEKTTTNKEMSRRDKEGQNKEHTTETLKKTEVQKGTSETEKKISELQSQVKMLEEDLRVIAEDRDKCAEEKDALQARLSQVFSVQIQENNPAIANLSDPLRPTIIAEKYNQLYDDEWTDGFQTLCTSGSTDYDSIQTLRDILMNCYVFCVKQADTQCQKVITSLLSFDSTKHYNKLQTRRLDDLDISQRAALNDLRRKTSVLTKETVINEYYDQEKNSPGTQQALLPFTEKCVELCWYMVLQSPPVYIEDCDKYTHGADFNTDVFKFYTRSGTKLDFVVWPPLYLYKDGPLLSKGIAQPFSGGNT